MEIYIKCLEEFRGEGATTSQMFHLQFLCENLLQGVKFGALQQLALFIGQQKPPFVCHKHRTGRLGEGLPEAF